MNWHSFRLWPVADVSYLVRDHIDAGALMASVSESHLGGTVLFSGNVRAGEEDGPVIAIEYSAYEEMAESECERIVSEAVGRWPDVKLAMQHRLGRVGVGEASIVIVAAAPHRAEAFRACRFAIDEVKKRVPIWKREFLQEGEPRWRSNDSPTPEGK